MEDFGPHTLDPNRLPLTRNELLDLWQDALTQAQSRKRFVHRCDFTGTHVREDPPVRIPVDYRYWIGDQPVIGRGYIVKARTNRVRGPQLTKRGAAVLVDQPRSLAIEALGGTVNLDLASDTLAVRTSTGVLLEFIKADTGRNVASDHCRRKAAQQTLIEAHTVRIPSNVPRPIVFGTSTKVLVPFPDARADRAAQDQHIGAQLRELYGDAGVVALIEAARAAQEQVRY